MSEWQDIKTAPKDWSDVLLYVPDLDKKSDFRFVCEGYFDTDGGKWKSPAFGVIRPAMWQPLPNPPTQTPSG